MEERKYYTPTNDYVFKQLFGRNKNIDITRAFLKAVLGVEYKNLNVREDRILDENRLMDEKIGILDVCISTDMQENIDIEMQVVKSEFIPDRILWYWSKLYAGDLKIGEEYENTKKVKCILIADFSLDKLRMIEKFKTRWHIREDEYSSIILTDKLEIVIIELGKLVDLNQDNTQDELIKWCKFIKNPDKMEDNDMSEDIKKAKEELDKINSDEDERRLAFLREKARLDEIMYRKSGYREGHADGKEEGRTESKVEIVKKLFERNMDIEDICDITELSVEEVKKIIDNI